MALHRSNAVLIVSLAALSAAGSPGSAQLTPEAALASLEPAEGLEVSLFAAEPLLVNPTCIDVDPQGSVWVCEGVNYRGHANPPHRAGGDRVVVLEDTDGDGRADRSRVFYQGPDLAAPLGICWLGDRILVSQSPKIISIAIRPDGTAGERRDFLTGFRGVNHDHGVHSLLLGPDGLLYGAFGNEGARVTGPDGRKLFTDGKPWFGGMAYRVRLDGAGLEGLAHNFRNNYECALDSFGTIFQSDNDDDGNQWVRFTVVFPGGNYGFVGPTGRHWSEEKKSHWHMEDPGVVPIVARTGAGSPTGLCVYEGDLLPERFRGLPIHCDAGPRVVHCFRLEPAGAGYRMEGVPLDGDGKLTIENLSKIVTPEILLTGSDSWFRPSDVAVAPDGSLLVSDWYDPGVGGHGMGDFTRGRIYRLTPKGHRGYRSPPLELGSGEGLARALASPCLSTRSLAQLRLREMGEKAIPILERIASPAAPPAGGPSGRAGDGSTAATSARARALWILGSLPGGRGRVESARSDPDPRFRLLAARSLRQSAPGGCLELLRPLIADRDPAVRREVLLLLRDLPEPAAIDAVADLASRYEAGDRFYLAAVGIASRGREGEVFRRLSPSWKGRFGRAEADLLWELHPSEAAPFLSRMLREAGSREADRREAIRILSELPGRAGAEELTALLSADVPEGLKREAAERLSARLGGEWKWLRKGRELEAGAIALLAYPGLAPWGARLAGAGGLEEVAASRLVPLARDRAAPLEARLAAVEAIGALAVPAGAEPLAAIAVEGPEEISAKAVEALGMIPGDVAQASLRRLLLEGEDPKLRSAAVKSLGSSKSGSLLLLELSRAGSLPDGARALATTVVHSSAFEEVRLLALKILPRPQAKGGQPIPPVAELLHRAGQARKGRKVFFEESKGNCARCHRVEGKGSDVGPDLSAIGTKSGRDALLESILSPSASISHEYRVWILSTRSAGLVSGYLVEETREEITLRDANGKRLAFKTADVTGRAQSDVSLMPEGLVNTMTADDLVDLVAFLSEQKAPAAPTAGGK